MAKREEKESEEDRDLTEQASIDRGTLVVTGASRGIGAAIARLAGRQGYRVAVNYRSNVAAAEAVVREIEAAGGRACAFRCDTAVAEEVSALFEAAESECGAPLSGLVNNAGVIGRGGRLEDLEEETLRRVIDINVIGVILCAREAVRRMSRKNGGSGGSIVNISSTAATLGSPGEFVWYAASKGAVDSLTLGMAKELGEDGIRVNAVSPGLIETEIHASSGDAGRIERFAASVPLKRAGKPEEVAEAVIWLLSDAASYITGSNLRIAGGR